jgi:hypothetical protein
MLIAPYTFYNMYELPKKIYESFDLNCVVALHIKGVPITVIGFFLFTMFSPNFVLDKCTLLEVLPITMLQKEKRPIISFFP